MSLTCSGFWDAPVVGFSGSGDQRVSDAFEGTSEAGDRLSAPLDACSYTRPPEDVLLSSGVLWNFNMCLIMGIISVNYN